jgi:hypothetical protein
LSRLEKGEPDTKASSTEATRPTVSECIMLTERMSQDSLTRREEVEIIEAMVIFEED